MTWFRDRWGKFSGEEGGLILEMILRRRETALAQVDLLRKRSEHRGLERLTREQMLIALRKGRAA